MPDYFLNGPLPSTGRPSNPVSICEPYLQFMGLSRDGKAPNSWGKEVKEKPRLNGLGSFSDHKMDLAKENAKA